MPFTSNNRFQPAPKSCGFKALHGVSAITVTLLAACGGGNKPTLVPGEPTFAATPAQAMRTVPTTFTVVGKHLPTSGITVTLPDDTDTRAQCNTPTGMTATGFTVVCTLYQFDPATDAQRKLVISAGGKQLGTHTVSIQSNITDVTWAAASTGQVYGKGTVHIGENVSFKVSGSNLMADTNLSFAAQQCSSPSTETGTPTATERTFSCVFSGIAAGQMPGTLTNAPDGHTLYSLSVPLVTAPAQLPDTGTTAAQCYAAGSHTLVSCTSAAAIALNDKQDGMLGRDVTEPANSDGKLGFSYSPVGAYSKEECVRDNITGLTWEGKPTTGLRAAGNTYNNLGDNNANDASTYVATVNAIKLCGYSDWRLPTADELQTLVDYSVAYPGPSIDSTWFPNTQQWVYWTATPYAGEASSAWDLYFDNGGMGTGNHYNYIHVRLVR
jgi:hypothetical protein